MSNTIHTSLNKIQKIFFPEQQAALKIPKVSNQPTAAETRVTISDAARHASRNIEATADAATKTYVGIKDFLKDIDFHHASPREIAILGGKLFERGYISVETALSFTGIEFTTEVKMNEYAPIDIASHFNSMLATVEKHARSDSTLRDAVAILQNASDEIQRLNNVKNEA